MDIFLSLMGILIALAVGISIWRGYRYRKTRKPVTPETRRCTCGYLLTGLEIPRCPECGRAIGFNCGFEDLGISEMEVRENIERKKAAKDKQARA